MLIATWIGLLFCGLALQGAWGARGSLRGLRLRLVGALVLEAVDALVRLSDNGEGFSLVLARALKERTQGLVSRFQLGDVCLGSAETLAKVA